ncbi:hypothetical protein NB311A_01335 [Nitrobacter sp. Nb-311A]|uniref:hypothetical protein n=1 Tax=unclassified Nitrobacter TaxID=2620411 RepID=UPI00006866E2|nr:MULTISPECIES: hypothetical protein [unclassified Nitrobacter]EAQ35973.1 hypothetical protein NB311A_01335 [Nitrobacter sp. Nb-311A]MCB1394000.1 hypothetical protein [Nitrobacter sp.]
MNDQERVGFLLKEAKRIAREYYHLTKKPLGVTGEVAEYEAAEKLGLTLEMARTPAFDAFRDVGGCRERYQIKGRTVSSNDRRRGRVPKIVDGQFDAVLLVLPDKATLETLEIWQADRPRIIERLDTPGSRARNERRSMAISQFVSIAEKVWPKAQ